MRAATKSFHCKSLGSFLQICWNLP